MDVAREGTQLKKNFRSRNPQLRPALSESFRDKLTLILTEIFRLRRWDNCGYDRCAAEATIMDDNSGTDNCWNEI